MLFFLILFLTRFDAGLADGGATIRAVISFAMDAFDAGWDISTCPLHNVWVAAVPVCDWCTQMQLRNLAISLDARRGICKNNTATDSYELFGHICENIIHANYVTSIVRGANDFNL